MASLLERRGRKVIAVDRDVVRSEQSTGVNGNGATILRLGPGEKIFDRYYWEEVLQEEGDGGKVVVCRSKCAPEEDGFQYVMKIRSKESLRKRGFETTFRKIQLRMLSLPAHCGVIPTHEVLEDDRFMYVVMEKASESDFIKGLLREFSSGVIPIAEMKRLTREMLDAVGHIHNQGILHRDIKPDNFVLEVRDEPSSPTGKAVSPKLIDFDHADPEFDSKSAVRRTSFQAGTLCFNAPETFLGVYSEQSDLYSVGACVYLLMAGKMPYDEAIFEIAGPKEQYYAMRRAQVDWECDPWPQQQACKTFCESLLECDLKKRVASVEEALKSAWFTDRS